MTLVCSTILLAIYIAVGVLVARLIYKDDYPGFIAMVSPIVFWPIVVVIALVFGLIVAIDVVLNKLI